MAENRTYQKFQKKLAFESHEVMPMTNALGRITPSDARKGGLFLDELIFGFHITFTKLVVTLLLNVKYQFEEYSFVQKDVGHSCHEECVGGEAVGIDCRFS